MFSTVKNWETESKVGVLKHPTANSTTKEEIIELDNTVLKIRVISNMAKISVDRDHNIFHEHFCTK